MPKPNAREELIAFMAIAQELETHAAEELAHAITISKQIDDLGGMPTATPTDNWG